MKYMRLINNTAIDVISTDPFETFHPDLPKDFVECPEEVENGWRLQDGEWVAPPPVEPKIRYKTVFTKSEFKLLFTLQERTSITALRMAVDGNNMPTQDAIILNGIYEIIEDPETKAIDINSTYITDLFEYLIQINVLTQEKVDEIKSITL